MELRNCSNTHYFQAIRGDSVIKVHNIDSHVKPALSFRTSKDLYESEDVKRPGRPSTSDMDILSAGSVFCHDQVKSETLCFPHVDRKLKEVKLAFDDFFICGDDDDDIDRDLDDNTTLKQLRERSKTKTLKEVKLELDELVPCGNDADIQSNLDHNSTLKQLTERSKTKKRKLESCTGVNSEQADANRKHAEDESDIDEPLINWKSKLSKNSKAKRKCTNKNVMTSLEASLSIKSEKNQLSEGLMQVGAKLPPVIRVTAEVPEPEPQGCPTRTCFSDDSSTDLNEGSKLGGIASNGISMECENREALIFAEECQNCVTNEVSYDHLEHVEPISVLLPSNGRTVKVEYQEMDCQEFLVLAPSIIETEKDNLQVLSSSSPAEIQGSYMHCTRSSSQMEEISGQTRGDSGGQVPNPAVDNNIGCTKRCNGINFYLFVDSTKEDLLDEKNGSLTSPDNSCITSEDSSISLEINDNSAPLKVTMADEESLTFTTDAVATNGLNSRDQLEDELSKSKERQTPASPGTYKERKPSLDYQGCDITNTLPTLELYQPPQRLLSTRKVISPYSQEQLCLNMNSVELHDEVDQCKCKGKFWLENQDENVHSGRSDIEHSKITERIGEPVVRSQRKVFINPRQILKKSQNCKASLPKGNLEGPRFSRTLPNFSTGCSTKGCSESAIAFSQRQMHDIESLAMKLMTELKSMKDIVEEKLLFEAYRNTALKNDAEEVKAAIDNSTKVEETAKKWLSMMNRDCNRFCKIMKLSQNSVTASTDVVKRERKKIMFADEAGGNLCHVKFFEDGVTSPVSVSQTNASDAELQQG
ncbi:uncharacterized protein LOC111393891 [Olea europaea var. sylvestris]|uniref:uncharacterized protein LOC111393891 n=1 Tax=Olea europaea var. sylvestris TaxID=158386 RepID=UPI000C1D2EB9|nr:uncharacterized protein LOC111393891 [Olea europaea var. sylvestris]